MYEYISSVALTLLSGVNEKNTGLIIFLDRKSSINVIFITEKTGLRTFCPKTCSNKLNLFFFKKR